MRLVFYGTPGIAVPPLQRLVHDGRAPVLVVTRADRPRGRGLRVEPTPVREAAEAMGLAVATPERASAPDAVERVRALAPDLLVLVAYGQKLSPELLAVPRLGALNLHFSLLPRHRGAAPIQAAILAGDAETGVTTMWMTAGIDEGPIFLARSTPIAPDEDAGRLGARLAELGADCLAQTVDRIERGSVVREPQDGERATYAPKIGRGAGRLSGAEDAALACRRVRALTPEPGAFLDLETSRLLVLAARAGDSEPSGSTPPGTVRAVDRERGVEVQFGRGTLWLVRVRPSGRGTMSGAEYAHGARLRPGARLPLKPGAA